MILHFATILFTAVPNFRRNWMRVPAAYEETKNQINPTTHITAGSCYREVRWKLHVGTNGQKATISHLSARSKHKNWPSPPWSCCIAGHREVHQEKMPHFNKQFAQGCWKLKRSYLPVLGLFARDSSLCDYTIHSSAKLSASLNAGASGLQANRKSNPCDHSHHSRVML